MAFLPMRGLHMFISDIRACGSREEEMARVLKELAHIRAKFRSDRGLSAYNKKKYVWKLLYIHMLGYDVDFGHMEAVSLISSYKYSEKQVGYIVTAVLLREGHEFLRLVINTIRTDISEGSEAFQCMALIAAANIGGAEFAEALTDEVQKLLLSNFTRPVVKKKAALCLLSFHRKVPELFPAEDWSTIMIQLLEESHLGLLLCSTELLLEFLKKPSGHHRFEGCLPSVVRILQMLTQPQNVPHEFCYYGIPSPWLQVNCIQILQRFPPPSQRSIRRSLLEVMQHVVMNTEIVKNDNKNNAAHAILFEGLALVMHLKFDTELIEHCITLLGKFIAVRQANIRYLGLDNMARLCTAPAMLDHIRLYQEQIMQSLRDPDISIRRRALDLMYIICDQNNAVDIIDELLTYLSVSDVALREELTHKIAILAEKFAPTHKWYIDVMLNLIDKSSEYVVDEMWFHLVHVVTNQNDLQEYAAAECLELLRSGPQHNMVIKVTGYVLGDFGHLLRQTSPFEIMQLLLDQFPFAEPETKAILLCAMVKLLLRSDVPDPIFRREVTQVLEIHASSSDAETQQRAVELYNLLQYEDTGEILAQMPAFPEPLYPLLDHLGSSPQQSGTSEYQYSGGSGEEESGVGSALAEESSEGTIGQASKGLSSGDHPNVQTKPATVATVQPSARQVSGTDQTDTFLPFQGVQPPSSATKPQKRTAPPGGDAVASDAVLSAPTPKPPLAQVSMVLPELAAEDAIYGEIAKEDLLVGGPAVIRSHMPAHPRTQRSSAAQGRLNQVQSVRALPGSTASTPSRGSSIRTGGTEASQPVGDIQAWYHRLILSNSGVLYEDQYLQVGVKTEYKDCNGKLVFFFGNKHTSELHQLSFEVEDIPALHVQELETCPQSVGPKQQMKYSLVVQCRAPFETPPGIRLAYTTSGDAVHARLQLPVTVSKFVQPIQLQASEFFSKWKSISGAPSKMQQVLQTPQPWSAQALGAMVQSFGLGVCPGLDPNPANVVASGNFLEAARRSVLCMVRVEVDGANPCHLRLTVASHDQTLSPAMHHLLVTVGLKAVPL